MHQRGPRRDRAGDHDPARLEPAITGNDDRNEHPFVDPEPAEPLRDDHIDTFRRLEVHDVAVDHLDDLRDPVRGGKLLRQDGDRRPLHRVDARSTRPCREHAQDAASGPDVENDVAGAHHRVDRTPEGLGANAVADHRAVYLELRVHRVRWVPDRRPHVSIVARRVTGALAALMLARRVWTPIRNCALGRPAAWRCGPWLAAQQWPRAPAPSASLSAHGRRARESGDCPACTADLRSCLRARRSGDATMDASVQAETGSVGRTEGVRHGFQATDKAARAHCRGGCRGRDSSPRDQEGRANSRRRTTRRLPTTRTRRNMRPLRRTRPTRSNTSHSCTPRARSQTTSSRRPRRRYSGPERMPDCQKMPNRSIPGRNRG